MPKYEIASSWHNKAAAVKEAEYYRKNGIPSRVIKARGFSTAWNCWIDSNKISKRK